MTLIYEYVPGLACKYQTMVAVWTGSDKHGTELFTAVKKFHSESLGRV